MSGEIEEHVVTTTNRLVDRDRDRDCDLRMQILSEVAAALSSSLDLDKILEVILTGATASQGLGFNRAFLFLYDADEKRLTGQMAIGPSSAEEAGSIWHQLESMRLTLQQLLDSHDQLPQSNSELTEMVRQLTFDLNDESLIARVCHEGTGCNLEAVDTIDSATGDLLDRLGTRHAALVPLISKGKLLGLLTADNFITRQLISDDAVQMLEILARQAAVAMERAHLYDQQLERTAELERVNRLLTESQDQIIRFEKMSVIGELTSTVAHELRNPLTIVGGFANLMLKTSPAPEAQEYLNIIVGETRRAEAVLNEVLDFYRASQTANASFDLGPLVRRNVQLLQGRRVSDCRIDTDVVSQALPIFGNPEQLGHALYQLVKLTAEELVADTSLNVQLNRSGSEAVLNLRVSTPENLREQVAQSMNHLFGNSKTSQRLPLLVAGETIRYHGGTVELSTDAGLLPTLEVRIPLTEDTAS